MRVAAVVIAAAFALNACSSVRPCNASCDQEAMRWVRNSVEAAALYIQTYELATQALRACFSASVPARSCPEQGKPWGVILDVDETVLDNSEWRWQLRMRGESYSEAAWEAWVREERAPALPGTRSFVAAVKDLGGHVVFVTNRSERVCEATKRNLEAQGLAYDAVLCAQGERSKESRFARVREGKAAPNVPALDVVAYVGDNIQDFPGWTQDSCRSLAEVEKEFGSRFFVLPNPVYGSWLDSTTSAHCSIAGGDSNR